MLGILHERPCRVGHPCLFAYLVGSDFQSAPVFSSVADIVFAGIGRRYATGAAGGQARQQRHTGIHQGLSVGYSAVGVSVYAPQPSFIVQLQELAQIVLLVCQYPVGSPDLDGRPCLSHSLQGARSRIQGHALRRRVFSGSDKSRRHRCSIHTTIIHTGRLKRQY